MEKENKFSKIFSNLWMILIILFIYLPIIYVVIFSFNDSKSLTTFTGFSLRWYEKMLNDRTMLEPIYYTVLVAVLATLVSTVLGTITAIGLSKQKKIVRDVVLQINDLPVMNPDIVTAIGLMLLFISANVETSFWTLLLAHITFCTPYVILSIMPKLRTLDDNVAEAALDLGATPFQALTKVIIPQIMPAILSGALIAFSMSFDDFVISFFTTGTGVSNISIFVYSMSKRINPSINALSSIIVLVVTTILVIVNVVPMFRKEDKEVNFKKKKNKWIAPAIISLSAASLIIVMTVKMNSKQVLNVYNAGEYIAEGLVEQFEEEYDCKVNYEVFASNEEMHTKLMSGISYDILIPSDYMIERLISEEMLQPIDLDVITNMEYLTESVQTRVFDPEGIYSVPYFWGNVGILYDETVIDQQDVEEYGWDVFKLEKYNGLAYFYDNERDAFMVALKALGYSTNTDNMNEINAAYKWLIEMDEAIDPAYVTDECIDGMINGEKYLAVMYSGEACYGISENENLRYWQPQQGTNVWIDACVIPANAKNYELANQFINFLLEYDVALENSDYIGYTSPRGDIIEELYGEEGSYEGNEAYMVRQGYEYDETYRDVKVLREAIAELWSKVKMH